MGWLWLVGSIKLQVSFAKEPCKRDYIPQKRLIILRSLLIIATPYPYTLSLTHTYMHRETNVTHTYTNTLSLTHTYIHREKNATTNCTKAVNL